MTSRERIEKALNHEETDRIPIDIGSSGQTGINASTLYKLRKVLGLKEQPIEIIEPYQMLGKVDDDLRQLLGIDAVPLWCPMNLFGTKGPGVVPWTMHDGTPVLMPAPFVYEEDKEGNVLVYPQGDRNVKPSLKMPSGGYFFDNLDRSGEIDENDLDARRDFKNLYGVFSDEDARFLEESSIQLYEETDAAIHFNFNGGGYGDAAIVPGPYEKEPRGIRRLDDWYMAHYLYPDYLKDLFEMMTEYALKNLEIVRQAVGERITTINISCSDFGGQNGELISPEHFREFYVDNFKILNDWVHKNTSWKTHFHCCGSIVNILDDYVAAGFDVYNPVQISAAGMDAVMLKEKYGRSLTFWGGAVDTQKTLPFGTPEEVRKEVRERLEIFTPGGGFVFSTIHNIVGKTPVENLVAMLEEFESFNSERAVKTV